jgi:pimeloyl-ACP methyl ester carboxylesterase
MDLTARFVRTALGGVARVAPGPAARWALAYWNPRVRVRVRPDEEPVMREAVRERLVLDGDDIAVYRWGDGARPVLLMHGWISRASRWSPLIKALTARGWSPVAFDAPGHGESGGRGSSILHYREIARRLQDGHGPFAAVVGHSVGGLSAFFAVREGVAADRLITISAPADFPWVVDSLRTGLGLPERLDPRLRALVERKIFPGERDIWQRFSATHRPEELKLPMLLIHDEDDDMVDPGHARRLAEVHGDRADLLITRGLGHRRILAAPGVVDAVLDFASATDPVR